jgi:transmembrane sensor
MTNEEFQRLAAKCQDGTATKAEQEAFDKAYHLLSGRYPEWDSERMGEEETVRSGIYQTLMDNVAGSRQRTTIRRIARYAIAAAVIVCFTIGGLFLVRHQPPAPPIARHVVNDLVPGEDKATLTLANGQQIVLSKNMSGQLVSQAGTNVRMAAGGKVIYSREKGGPAPEETMAYNTLTTKKGQQFPLVLADGTEVTLDAASSITYPVSFDGKERKVTVTGQAYFKVTHNDRQPFIVSVRGQTIRDIGTEFNVNAYEDEKAIKTTLIDGSVKVSGSEESVVLKPGQQSSMADNSPKITLVKNADIESAVAWKNGLFQYDKASIQTVMRQFARWYDAEIQYEGNVPQRDFSGKMQRSLTASQALDLLSFTGIHFKIEGKTIIVTP